MLTLTLCAVLVYHILYIAWVGLGGSVGCAVRLETSSTPAEVGNILSWRLIMKYFLRSFSPFADSRRAVVSFWRKNVHNTG